MAAIVARAVLFNICRSLDQDEPPTDPAINVVLKDHPPSGSHVHQNENNAHYGTARSQLINEYFASMVN